jgi:membrane-associated phospholipid phosphatase
MQRSRYIFSPLICSLLILSSYTTIRGQSPYHSSWAEDGWIAGAGGAIALSAWVINSSVTPLSEQEVMQLSRSDVNAFDRPATYNYSESVGHVSDILVGLNVASVMLLMLDQDIRDDWQVLGLMTAETAMFVTFVPMGVKGLVQRIRPYAYNPEVPLEEKTTRDVKRSFFSGHTTTAFAFSVFISTVYSDYFPHSKWKPYIWTGSLLMASSIGFLRYESGKHFPTDILVGALVGTGIGYLIPRLHRQANHPFSILPVSESGNRGILFSFYF